MNSGKKAKVPMDMDNGTTLKRVERPVGRLLVGSSVESTEATKVLLQAGFRIVTLPVSGLTEPELSIGADAYHGITEIRRLAKKYKP